MFKIKEIAIGSTNPVKIQALKNVLYGEETSVISCSVESGVRPQPLSNEETLQGSINRAKASMEKAGVDLGVGLEGGVVFLEDQLYLCQWGALVDSSQNVYFTNGPLILLPKEYSQDLRAGRALEEIMHHSKGIENLGSKAGAIGIFTQNLLNREQVLTQMAKGLIGQYLYYVKNT